MKLHEKIELVRKTATTPEQALDLVIKLYGEQFFKANVEIALLKHQLDAERKRTAAAQVELDGADKVIANLKRELAAEREKVNALVEALKDMRGYDHDRVDAALAEREKVKTDPIA